ncbi:flavo protein [Coniella lustricola]|uniref:Flavo protein n=1 Tax=Coniella lustricola TaxID=2025994 RepID=A0A2T3AFV6_9PEZI|nr:flavo protein [Coniella lustricola]
MATDSHLAQLHATITDDKIHLLLAASGSVATIKLPNIINALLSSSSPEHLSIRIVLSSSARNFLAGQAPEQPPLASLLAIPGVDAIYTDEDEWGRGASIGPEGVWTRRNASVLHIDLRRWAHLMAIIPLSANTMAKIVNGLCDNLLTSVVRAWDTDGRVDGRRKRILVAPAMNTAMWLHPITATQIRVLSEDWGVKDAVNGVSSADGDVIAAAAAASAAISSESGWFEVLKPQQKTLACGDIGDGAMMEWTEVVTIIQARLGLSR